MKLKYDSSTYEPRMSDSSSFPLPSLSTTLKAREKERERERESQYITPHTTSPHTQQRFPPSFSPHLVHHIEGHVHKAGAALVELPTNGEEKLVVAD